MDKTDEFTKQSLARWDAGMIEALPDGDAKMRASIGKALGHLRDATPRTRNGPCHQAINTLRRAIGLPLMEVGGTATDGLSHSRKG